MANKKEKIRKTVLFPRVLLNKAEEIESTGYSDFSSVVLTAVLELHKRTFPRYLAQPFSGSQYNTRDREKEPIKNTANLDICDELGGTIQDTPNGQFCNYFTYVGKQRFDQHLPVEMLDPTLVEGQYQPSKEAVLKLQRERRVAYNVDDRPMDITEEN